MNSVSFVFKGMTPLVSCAPAHQLPLLSYEGFTTSQLEEGLVSSLCLPNCLPGVVPLFPEAVDPHSATITHFALLTIAPATLCGGPNPGRSIPGCLNRPAGQCEAGKLPISAA